VENRGGNQSNIKAILILLIFAGPAFGESKTERQLRGQVAELSNQLRTQATQLNATTQERDQLRAQLKNQGERNKAESQVVSTAVVSTAVPKLEKALAKQQQVSIGNQDRNFKETQKSREDMGDIRSLIVEIAGLQEKDHAEIAKQATASNSNTGMIKELQANLSISMVIGAVAFVIFIICVGFALYYIAFLHNKIRAKPKSE